MDGRNNGFDLKYFFIYGDTIMNNKQKNSGLGWYILYGVAFGNAFGLLIGITFTKENLGLGLLFGNTIGLVGGLIVGIVSSFQVPHE
jgi:hypothetical protein